MSLYTRIKEQWMATPEELEIGAKAKTKPDEGGILEELKSEVKALKSQVEALVQKFEKPVETTVVEVTKLASEANSDNDIRDVDTKKSTDLTHLRRVRTSFLNERKLARDRKDIEAAAECGAKILEIDEKIKALQGGD